MGFKIISFQSIFVFELRTFLAVCAEHRELCWAGMFMGDSFWVDRPYALADEWGICCITSIVLGEHHGWARGAPLDMYGRNYPGYMLVVALFLLGCYAPWVTAYLILAVAHHVSLVFVFYLTRAHAERLAISRAATLNAAATLSRATTYV